MVAIFASAGTGLERSSGNIVGAGGTIGSAAFGRGGSQVQVNAANGNLVIARQDEYLSTVGDDVAVLRVYNSKGDLSDTNGDNWRMGEHRQLRNLSGTVNASGSTINRIAADGAIVNYRWNGSAYATTDGAGAYDRITWDGTNWRWQDGDSGTVETYGADLRLAKSTDRSGHVTQFAYTDGRLSRITGHDGGYLDYSWSGNLITGITSVSQGTTTVRTRYGYDAQGRLSTVTVDRTAYDNSVADGNVYTTTYGYHGDSRLIASISETDGSSITFEYDGANRVLSMSQLVGGSVSRTTTLAYSGGSTVVTDPLGQVTTLSHDSAGRLTGITAPPAVSGGTAQRVQFGYNATGDLVSVTDAAGVSATYGHDANGNIVRQTDRMGDEITRTFNAANQVLTETQTGSDRTSDAAAHTTRHVYDTLNRLRYVVSAEGRVRETRYDSAGLVGFNIDYTASCYDVGGLSATTALSESQLDNWRGTADRSQSSMTQFVYDARGNLTQKISFGATNADGSVNRDSGYTHEYFVYDAAGQLLSRGPAGRTKNSFSYDGLGRVIQTTDVNGGTTRITFNDAATQTTVTLANGFVQTSTYTKSGELLSLTESGSNVTGGTASNQYDRLGRLRIATDATGRKAYTVYDGAGRRVADVVGNGEMTEYRYDPNDRIVAMVRYATNVTMSAALQDPNATVSVASLRPAAANGDLWDWTVYDREGRVVQTIDGDGSTSLNAYDDSGRLVATTAYVTKLTTDQIAGFRSTAPTTLVLPATNAADSVSRVFYDGDGNVIGGLNGEGYLSQVVYDAGGRKVQAIAYANVTAANLRAGGSFQALIDSAVAAGTANDRSTRFVYDQQGYLRYTIDAIGRVTELGYHYDGSKWTAFGPVRQTTRYAAPLGALSTYSFEAVRSAVAGLASNPANRTDWAVYDTGGRLTYAIDAAGAVSSYRYDNRGQVIARIDYATLRPTTTLPSPEAMADWASGAKGAADRTTRYYYNARGEVRYTIDAEGYVTRNDYDAEGRVVFTGRWDGKVAADDSWTTTSVGNAITGDYSATSRSYDARGRLSLLSDSVGGSTRYSYRANDQLVWEIRSQGTGDESKTFYDYDLAGRRSSVSAAYGTPEQSTMAYAYDGLGNLTRTVDGNGVAIAWTYDRVGQMVTETKAYGITTRHEYNAFGDRVRTIDPRGNSIYRYFDRLGRTVATRDAENYVTETGYTRFGEIEWVKRAYNRATNTAAIATLPGGYGTHALDATTRFEYDRLGRVTGTIDGEGHAERYTLDGFGNRITVTNKLGGVTVNTYDRRGLLTSQTLPITSITQEGQVRATSVVNRFDYDARGNRVVTIEAEGLAEERVTRNLYDKADRLIEVRGSAIPYLDAAFRTQSTDLVATYRYDTRGNLIESRDANGARTLFYYDDLDRKVAQIGPTGTLSTYTYSKTGMQTASRVYGTTVALPADPGGPPPAVPGGDFRETSFAYDALGRLRSSSVAAERTGRWNGSTFVLTADAITTGYQYDVTGNIIAETDAEGAVTYLFYDRNARKTAQVDKEGYVTRWTYDAEGNVRSERRYATQTSGATVGVLPAVADSGADRITEFGYDRNGNRTLERRLNVEWVSVSGGTIQSATGNSIVSYTYNGLGKITSKTEATGDTTRFVFDTMGRMTEEVHAAFLDHSTNEVRSKLSFAYDGLGNLTRMQQGDRDYAGGFRTTRYFYGASGRLDAKHDAGGGQTRYGYDAAGNLVQEMRFRKDSGGDILTEAMLYIRDLSGRITSQGMGRWNGTGWDRGDIQQTAYNAYGDISQRGMNGGWQEQFAYDRVGRLFRSNAGDGVWRYFVYDKLGNQTAAIESEGTSIHGETLDGILHYATQGFSRSLGKLYIDGINTTLTAYDRRGQATRTIQTNRELNDGQYVTDPTVRIVDIETARAYTAFGEVAWERDARGYYTHMAYNTMGRMLWRQRPQVEVTDANGQSRLVNPTEYIHYDLSGRAVASRDARGALTTRQLLAGTGYGGSEALVTRETTADGATVSRLYDQFLDLRASSNGIARWTYMNYDAMGRLTQVTRPGGQSDYYAYDMLGQRLRRWDSFYGATNAEQTDYDMQGRVVRQVSAGGSEGIADVTTTTYDWSSTLVTEGMGTFGGWVTTTTYANGRTSIGRADMFGRTVETTDLGHHVSNFDFDLAGRMTVRYLGDRYSGERTDYHYLNTGMLGSISEGENKFDTAPNNPGEDWNYESVVYGYDASGNRTSEYHSVDNGRWQNEYDDNGDPNYVYQQHGMSYQNATAQYDALGRMTRWEDQGGYTALEYRYDENGNIRRSLSSFYALDGSGLNGTKTAQDYWYTYDAMNRVTIAKGQLVGSQIERGYAGVGYQYDLAGQRVLSSRTISATAWIQSPNEDGSTIVFYDAAQQEEYGYDVDGRLTSVRIGTQGYADNGDGTVTVTDPAKFELKAMFGYDGIGRQTSQADYLYDGDQNGAVAWQRVATFNARGQVTNETSWQRQGNDTIRTTTTNAYGSGENYALGSIVHANSVVYKNNNSEYSADTNNYYEWFSGAAINIVHYKQSKQDLRISSYFYRANGELSFVEIADGRPRNVSYFSDMTGQIIERSEYARNGGTGNPSEKWYRFNGRTLGYVGNNGTLDTSYQESIGSRTRTQGTGPFAGGSNYASPYADFDQSVAPITSYAQGSGGGNYTVRAGDTLSGIAAQLWGDAGLWYKLAEANGLNGASALIAGQSLTIPTGVQKSTHNAATFTPYDPAEAMGDTSPSVQPKAKKNKCGAFGAILLTVIAVAVTALTAVALPAAVSPILTGAISATAGSVVSQAVGVATGIQNRFDWKGVAMAALSGAVGGAIGGVNPFGSGKDFLTGFANGAVRGALGSFVTQGLAVATHLQKEMNWLGVATAAVGGGVAGGLGNVLKLESLRDDLTSGNVARTALTNTAAGIANAATRALATGTSFGDNMLAALPDVIGQTVGGAVAAGVSRRGGAAAPPSSGTGVDFDSSASEQLANYEAAGVDLAENAAEGLQRTINRERYRMVLVAEEHAWNVAAAGGTSGGAGSPTYDYEITVTGRDVRPAVRTVEGEFASSAIVQREKAGYQASFDSKPSYYNVAAYKAAMASYDKWYAYLSEVETRIDARIDREIAGIVLAGPVAGGVVAGAVFAAPAVEGLVYANAFRLSTAVSLTGDFVAGTQIGTYVPAGVGGVTASIAAVEGKLPTIAFRKAQTPGIAANIEAAFAEGHSSILNRLVGRDAIRAQRADALAGQAKPPTGYSLDEFPFASSKQGGAGARVVPVPVGEQNVQGGMLSSFYQKHGITHGDPYRVIVIP
ncbi:NucA/NucB deoxyribonuclease domain-containing protein [Sphingomonas hankookensis]|uniref:NucA/NucB deoxyribonuclease domain-containing protein n=1 Tax=Sphingomonas hankookensis TaxID=563996 RepID=UPI001F58EB72|nr:NucA/NucB deoxyribonuclease domain-containing protein [Sphingomonas hankookensis]